ncbi:hypothetical protein ANASTE_00537 [Anaerofustis stercorihominis DSM 17244]|uniref:Uncharacterized protein n=1 Tax=Anaerofustis stercorihominis DSM 17244 TaxID=445971 RepID=B1C739_9FIRM|nr:hypothetical protein ANASTE_00537 [Anaerofustis stercorihominis DSM 17244]
MNRGIKKILRHFLCKVLPCNLLGFALKGNHLFPKVKKDGKSLPLKSQGFLCGWIIEETCKYC